MKSTPYPQIDWNSLHRKVLAVALNLFRKQGLNARNDAVLKGFGISPPDLAQESMRIFFTNWSDYDADTEGKCFALIVKIMKNDFLDAVTRKHAYIKTQDLDEEALAESKLNLEAPNNGLNEFEAQVLAEQLYPYAAGDPELKDVIDAAAMLAVEQDAEIKRDDIADVLSISPDEVTKRNNRLKYRFHKNMAEARNQKGS